MMEDRSGGDDNISSKIIETDFLYCGKQQENLQKT